MDISNMTLSELNDSIRSKKISCTEIVKETLDNIDKNNKEINAYITVIKEDALKNASDVQDKIDKGEIDSSVMGAAVGLKDNILTKDVLTTAASKMLENYVPIYSATVTERLEKAGAIIVGKNNLDEFASGSSTKTSYFGPSKNPWNTSHIPGGSSGGSAAAVASGQASFAIGTDTGGSIRQPSAFCGITGMKPTYGSVSRHGIIGYASSMDQAGPMGKSIRDCAEILSVISGQDDFDHTMSLKKPFDFSDCYSGDISGIKIGVPYNCFEFLDNDTVREIENAIKVYEKLGAKIHKFDIPIKNYATHVYQIISCAEASANLSRFDGITYGHSCEDAEDVQEQYFKTRGEGFGYQLKRKILLGSLALSKDYYEPYYLKALKLRRVIKDKIDSLLKDCDVILTPVSPDTAPKFSDKQQEESRGIKDYMADVFTSPVNLANLPAASFPCGFDDTNMPVGMQLVGSMFADPLIVKVGHAFQMETDFHKKQIKGAK